MSAVIAKYWIYSVLSAFFAFMRRMLRVFGVMA